MQRKCGRNSFSYEYPQLSIPITRGSLLTVVCEFDYVMEWRINGLDGPLQSWIKFALCIGDITLDLPPMQSVELIQLRSSPS